ACRRRRFAVVQCEGLELYRYARTAPAPLILDAHNAEWRLQRAAYQAALREHRVKPAVYSLLQWRKLVRYEGTAVRRARVTFAVSAADQGDLQQLAPGAAVAVLANGVDAELYQPLPALAQDTDSILFAGKMDFRPNVEGALWLAHRVMPRVWSRRPAARLVLFGRDPAPAVRRLAADPRITVTGHVPGTDAEKVALANAGVVAVPLLSGGGTRLKVLNALAMARPVVSTPLGATGYAVTSGQHLLLAEGAGPFADALLRLLEQPDLGVRLGMAGRRAVCSRYTWERVLPVLDHAYAELGRG
ncbi:MAG TPA: glycosyltransferase family 4 protein, partial [Chloroflexota bacterium]|nr:glycosyltransferase family 4 protein [Chloroflexota bacterium]